MTEEIKCYYVRRAFWPWESMEINIFPGHPVRPPSGSHSIGFMEVYDSEEDFQKDYPDEKPMVLKEGK